MRYPLSVPLVLVMVACLVAAIVQVSKVPYPMPTWALVRCFGLLVVAGVCLLVLFGVFPEIP